MTALSLPETVIALQRLDLPLETSKVVEEAARLLQDGREMEARALVEKAEALAARASHAKPNGNGNRGGTGNGNGNGLEAGDRRWAGTMIAPIAEKLASGFSAVLTTVLEDIFQHTGDQVQVVASVLEVRIHCLEESLRKSGTFDLESRIQAVEERLTGVDQIVRDLQPQVSTVLTRLDRHTDTLRSLEQRHAQRVSALNQVLDHLSRLREEEPASENSLPLM